MTKGAPILKFATKIVPVCALLLANVRIVKR